MHAQRHTFWAFTSILNCCEDMLQLISWFGKPAGLHLDINHFINYHACVLDYIGASRISEDSACLQQKRGPWREYGNRTVKVNINYIYHLARPFEVHVISIFYSCSILVAVHFINSLTSYTYYRGWQQDLWRDKFGWESQSLVALKTDIVFTTVWQVTGLLVYR